MGFIEVVLISLWAGYCSYDDQGPQMLRRPLLVAPVVGIIMGDLSSALIIGGTLELMWMGLGNMAGYSTPDMITGTIVGTAFSITSGGGVEGIAVGVALATAVAVLCQQLLTVIGVLKQAFVPWADKVAESGDFSGLTKIQLAGAAMHFLLRAVPTFLVLYFGDNIINAAIDAIPSDVLTALSTASGVLPAIGLSILMTIIMKKGMWAFLIFGFVLNAYLGLDTMAVALISLAFGTVYVWFMQVKEGEARPAPSADTQEGEYDL